jgi:Protein of unknown function (DUF4239)
LCPRRSSTSASRASLSAAARTRSARSHRACCRRSGSFFALVVGFLAAGVWNDGDRARLEVSREASALRTALLLVDGFPEAQRDRMRTLIRRHIDSTVVDEWPAMAHHEVTLTATPAALARALGLGLSLKSNTAGQKIAQREITAALENALDARRQRIIISEARVNWVKWAGVMALATLALLAIAFVHSASRATAALAIGTFASAVAVSIILIASHNRPFGGPFGVKPSILEQVMPQVPAPAEPADGLRAAPARGS